MDEDECAREVAELKRKLVSRIEAPSEFKEERKKSLRGVQEEFKKSSRLEFIKVQRRVQIEEIK